MRSWLTVTAVVGVVLAAGVLAHDASAGKRKAKPSRAKTKLVPAADAGAKGKVDVKFWPETPKRAERSRLRFRLSKLEPGGDYMLWMDDPRTPSTELAPATFPAVPADPKGRLVLDYDTREGDAFPFQSDLEALGGRTVHVRGESGASVLVGTVPSLD